MIENGGNVMAGRGFEINDLLPHGDSHRSEGNMSYCRVRNSLLERYWDGLNY